MTKMREVIRTWPRVTIWVLMIAGFTFIQWNDWEQDRELDAQQVALQAEVDARTEDFEAAIARACDLDHNLREALVSYVSEQSRPAAYPEGMTEPQKKSIDAANIRRQEALDAFVATFSTESCDNEDVVEPTVPAGTTSTTEG
jgi:hypothetical protein